MMEWLSDDPGCGESVLALFALAITGVVIWLGVVLLGRKRLVFTILVAFTWLLLAAMTIPSFIPAGGHAYRNECINNLRQIREAKVVWENTEHKLPSDLPTEEILFSTGGTNGFLRHNLVCPRGGKYAVGAVGEIPTCSFADMGHKLE